MATVASLFAAGHFNQLRLSEARAAASERLARHEAEVAAQEADTAAEGEGGRPRGGGGRSGGSPPRRCRTLGRYRSSIAAAAMASHEQNSGPARVALDAAPPEHRNWEWQHFRSQLDGARLVIPVPGGPVECLVLSPSGRQIAVSCSGHNQIYLFGWHTGRLEAVLRVHSNRVESLAYRPDGKQIATGTWDRAIGRWDPATGRELGLSRIEVFPKKGEGGQIVAYSSDGRRILSYADEIAAGTSRLWDAGTGRQIAILGDWQGVHRAAAFSPDGTRVAATSREYVRLCDADTGHPIASLGPHTAPVEKVAYSPDGLRVASAGFDGTSCPIHLWDAATRKEVAVLRGHTAGGMKLLFSPDGSRLVSGNEYPDNTGRMWDAATGRLLAILTGHKNTITALAFSPDGKRAATSSRDHTARLWDGQTGRIAGRPGRAHVHRAACRLQP